MHSHVAVALEEQRRQFQLETQNQERRVAKLVESLERTEKLLARVASSKDLDYGIESIYSSVQGLSRSDDGFERKQDLLGRIFEENLALKNAGPSAVRSA